MGMSIREAQQLLYQHDWELEEILLTVMQAKAKKKDPVRELAYKLMIDAGTAEELIRVAKESHTVT